MRIGVILLLFFFPLYLFAQSNDRGARMNPKPKKETISDGIYIYPNPVQHLLTINSKKPVQFIKIYNALGILVAEKSHSAFVELVHLKKGTYFISFVIDGKKRSQNFIKQ